MSLAEAKAELSVPVEPVGRNGPSPKRRRRADPAVIVSVLALVVLVASMLHVAQRAKLAALTYDLHRATLRLAEEQRVQSHLQVEIERARSLTRIEANARTRLGLRRPEATEWVVLDPRSTSEQMAAANGQRERGPVWSSLLAQWFDRVRSEVRAALPLTLRDSQE